MLVIKNTMSKHYHDTHMFLTSSIVNIIILKRIEYHMFNHIPTFVATIYWNPYSIKKNVTTAGMWLTLLILYHTTVSDCNMYIYKHIKDTPILWYILDWYVGIKLKASIISHIDTRLYIILNILYLLQDYYIHM